MTIFETPSTFAFWFRLQDVLIDIFLLPRPVYTDHTTTDKASLAVRSPKSFAAPEKTSMQTSVSTHTKTCGDPYLWSTSQRRSKLAKQCRS